MINYSFIIPHKNTPDLLKRCIDSIPKRDDIQVIIIDDNSSEEIVDFADFPGLNNKNYECIFDKEGRGAGHARNIGLRHSLGKWLIFADADDYFTEKLTTILNKYINNDADMVFLNANSIDEKNKISQLALNRYISNFIRKTPYALSVLKYGIWSPWSRMVKRHIVVDNSIEFEEIPIGNDTMFVLNATRMCKSFEVEKDIVYMYYQPVEGSQTFAKYNPTTVLSRLEHKFKINRLYSIVDYPFKWPIERPFVHYDLKESDEYKMILKKNKYNRILDYYIYTRYVVAKLFRII